MGEYLDINAAAPNPDKPGIDTNQGPEEQQIVKMALDLRQEGVEARKEFDQNWDKLQDSYNDKQWDEQRPKYKANPVLNMGRAAIQTIVPILTDAKPKFNPEPVEPTDYDFADTLSKAVDFWWERNSIQLEIVSGLYDSSILGTGIGKVTYDEDAAEGEGDVCLRILDPKSIYVPKGATDFNNKTCPWVYEEKPMRVGELKMLFPKMAQMIRPDSGGGDSGTAKAESFSKEVKLVSPVDRDIKLSPVTQELPNQDNLTATYGELWMDDHSVEEYVLEHEDGQGGKTYEKLLKKKYPRGKLVSLLPNSKILLQCEENPYRDGLKPYFKIVNTVQPRKFWGDGVIGPLENVQKMVNKTFGVILDWMNYMGNPVWIVDKEAGVDTNALTNQIGLIIPKNKEGEVRRDWPQPLPSQVFELYNVLLSFGDTITGVHDVTQGRKPAGVTAAEAIYELQEAAQTRIRLMERNLNIGLQQAGRLVISRMLQFYKQPRMVKITGKGAWPEYFQFRMEDVKGENGEDRVKMVKQSYLQNKQGRPQPNGEPTESEPTRGLFDIKVSSGTQIPFAKAQKAGNGFKLHEAKVIGDLDLLQSLDWPNPEQTIERNKQQQAEAAQMAAQAQPPQGA